MAASNAPHTLHALESITIAGDRKSEKYFTWPRRKRAYNFNFNSVASDILEIRGDPKIPNKVTWPHFRPPMAHLCMVFAMTPTLHMHAKFQVSSFSRSRDMRGSKNLKLAPPPFCGVSGPTSNTMCHVPERVFSSNSILICSAVFCTVKPRWAAWQTHWQTDRRREHR